MPNQEAILQKPNPLEKKKKREAWVSKDGECALMRPMKIVKSKIAKKPSVHRRKGDKDPKQYLIPNNN